jgi:HSP20 family protein
MGAVMSETTGAVQRAREPAAVQPAVKPENPLDRMNLIFEDVARRAFEIFEDNGRVFGHDLENWFKAERELLHPVNIELTETEGAFEIKAEVPGFSEKELEISAEPRRVVIAGKHESKTEEQKKGKVVRSEACAEQMLRVVELPGPIETAKVTATLRKNGILTLTLPKVAPAQPVRIKPAAL